MGKPSTQSDILAHLDFILCMSFQVFVTPWILYEVGNVWFHLNKFTVFECIQLNTISTLCNLALLAIYFLVQRYNEIAERKTIIVEIPSIDDRIPFDPRWIWIYGPLGLSLSSVILTAAPDHAGALRILFGEALVVAFQCTCFLSVPTSIPQSFRDTSLHKPWKGSISLKFLLKLQQVDHFNCAFPSGHCSLSVYAAFALQPILGVWSFIVPILIMLSCVFTKQHTIMDTVAGVIVGFVIQHLIRAM